jgi:molybdopterin molybdotransferase
MSSPLRPLDDALADLLARAHPVAQCDLVPTLDACARVLARDQYATLDVPSADNTQMDGYAMRAADVPPSARGCRSASGSPPDIPVNRWNRAPRRASLPAPSFRRVPTQW